MKKTIILRTVCTVLIIAAIAVPIIAFGGGNASETEESAVLKIRRKELIGNTFFQSLNALSQNKIKRELIATPVMSVETARLLTRSEDKKPTRLDKKNINIFLIKKTMWDSNLYDGYKYDYTIYVYKNDPKFENQKQIESNAILEKLRNQLDIK